MFETRMTYACAFANADLDNSCPDLKLACPPGTVIHILNELYGKEYSLYQNCITGAIINCSSVCCNGRSLFNAVMPISQENQNELHSNCNDQNQCSLEVDFPKNIIDHLEYVSVSYRCKKGEYNVPFLNCKKKKKKKKKKKTFISNIQMANKQEIYRICIR